MIYGADGQPVLRSIEPGELELAGHVLASELAVGGPVRIELERYQAFSVVGSLQLALRHPGMVGPSAEIVRAIAESLAEAVAGESTVLREAFAMGWDSRCDEMGMNADANLALSESFDEPPGVHPEEIPEACPVCGCTEAMACPDDGTGQPCRWVAVVVCSACATNVFGHGGEVKA